MQIALAPETVAQRPPRTYRTAEISEALGVSYTTASKRVREWLTIGFCTPVKAPYTNAWGVTQKVLMVQFPEGYEAGGG